MILKTLFVRFYKSFNYDYLRKNHRGARRQPWEQLEDGTWYPHVRVPIDSKITTVVGANESGKTHLLSAVRKGIEGAGIKRLDFCRYSRFFAVEQGKMRWPGFGFEWVSLDEADRSAVRKACKLAEDVSFDRFLLFREEKEQLTIYLPDGDSYTAHKVQDDTPLSARLPSVFHLDAKVGLPDSVPLSYLAESESKASTRFGALSRTQRHGLVENLGSIFDKAPTWFKDAASVNKSAQPIATAMAPILNAASNAAGGNGGETKALQLARDLLHKVARIDPHAFAELDRALRDGQEGYANGLIQKINERLEKELNFPKWWVQDKDFKLRVSPREFDLVLTIRDRTGTDYLFSERSSGLKYFLSYYVQYRAHELQAGRPEILLMDEPDAFLSSQAQQDLLKIFHAFAEPADGDPTVQVIYVTHSPFLIDRNHSERIRVLDKGRSDEGTRVVKDASKNHYEPLRSAFGAFVGETTFMGNCNLMVEGPADQILLAGSANLLRKTTVARSETLDLNRITIVPCGSASHIPYMVYLARGRDIEQPAVVVLLDSDKAGNEAKKQLARGGPKRKQLIKPDYVLQVGDLANPSGCVEIEDLIPWELCADAARKYVVEFCGGEAGAAASITAKSLEEKAGSASSRFKAIQECVKEIDADYHIDKVGFARLVLDTVPEAEEALRESFFSNMKALFTALNTRRRAAERELTRESVSRRVKRTKQSFLDDNPDGATRDRGRELLEDMESVLDDSREADEVRSVLQELRREFQLSEDLAQPIDNYDEFKARLEQIQYAGRLATQTSS